MLERNSMRLDRRLTRVGHGATRADCFPLRVMTVVSPRSAKSTSLLKQARASFMLMARMLNTPIVYITNVHYVIQGVNVK
jgi:hypothetical protein